MDGAAIISKTEPKKDEHQYQIRRIAIDFILVNIPFVGTKSNMLL